MTLTLCFNFCQIGQAITVNDWCESARVLGLSLRLGFLPNDSIDLLHGCLFSDFSSVYGLYFVSRSRYVCVKVFTKYYRDFFTRFYDR